VIDQKTEGTGLRALRAVAGERQRVSNAELLELLSVAAEELGDLNRAEQLEKARLDILTGIAEKKTAELRLLQLRQLRRKVERELNQPLVVDKGYVAAR